MPDTVRFVASFTPDSMWGKAIPAQVLAWRFTPDSTGVSSGDLTQYCLYPRTAYTCKLNIWRPGTMHVDMRINGRPETADLHVELREGELTLDANPTTIYAGDSVTFTAGADPEDFAFSISEWWWDPDDPPIMAALYRVEGGARSSHGGSLIEPDCAQTGTTCKVPIHGSGRMIVIGSVSGKVDTADARVEVKRAELTLLADKRAVSPGEPVTFTAGVVPLGTAFAISAWEWIPTSTGQPQAISCGNPCVVSPNEPGTMRVEATVVGDAQTASVYVQVISCPTPPDRYDSLANEQPFRDFLEARLGESNPDATSDSAKIEIFFFGLRNRITGEVELREHPIQAGTNNCKALIGALGYDPAQYELLFIGHTHPYGLGDRILFCGSDPDGRLYAPGASEDDHDSLMELIVQLLQAEITFDEATRVAGYIIDKNFVGRYELLDPAGVPPDQLRETLWPHSNPSCPWF